MVLGGEEIDNSGAGFYELKGDACEAARGAREARRRERERR